MTEPICAKDSQGMTRPVLMEDHSRALITTSDAAAAIHRGDHYFLKTWMEVHGKNTVLDLVFHTPPLPVRIHGNGRMIPQKTEFTFGFWEDAILTDPGTLVPTFNNDRSSEKQSGMLVYANPTIADLGHDIWPAKIGIAGQVVTTNFNYEYFPKPDTWYITRLTKNTTGKHWIDIDFWWHESPDRDATYSH
jgi:hypothetical protein